MFGLFWSQSESRKFLLALSHSILKLPSIELCDSDIIRTLLFVVILSLHHPKQKNRLKVYVHQQKSRKIRTVLNCFCGRCILHLKQPSGRSQTRFFGFRSNEITIEDYVPRTWKYYSLYTSFFIQITRFESTSRITIS